MWLAQTTPLGWADPHSWTELTVFSILRDWVLWEASQEGEGKLQSSQLNEMDLEGWSLSRQEGMKIKDRTGKQNWVYKTNNENKDTNKKTQKVNVKGNESKGNSKTIL